MAEYDTASGVEEKPTFSWWVPYTLKQYDDIVSAVPLRLIKCLRKYGI